MMKTIAFAVLFNIVATFAFAATGEGILFEKGSWKEVVAKAKKEKKIIFIDCYTSWCGPCKRLASEVFVEEKVAAFFNENFVCYKSDMEVGTGIDLSKTFHVGAYPTLLWVDGSGSLVHRTVGFIKADALLAEASKALNGGNVTVKLETDYNNHKDDPAVVAAYLQSLNRTADSREREVALHYLSIIPEERYLEKDIYNLIAKHVPTPFSPAITYIYANRKAFDDKFGKANVGNMLQEKYSRNANQLVSAVKAGKEFDEAAFQKLLAMMDEKEIASKEELLASTRIKELQYKGKWQEYVAKVNDAIAHGIYKNINTRTWHDWYSPVVASKCTDTVVLENALHWIDSAFNSNEAFAMSYFKGYWTDKVNLLQRMPHKEQQLAAAKSELALLAELETKQEAFYKMQAERKRMLENMLQQH